MDFLIEGILNVTWQQCVMYVIGALLIWLGIKKEYEPSELSHSKASPSLITITASFSSSV